jgi:phosphoribosylaminoimidazole-succinocarboxamide synthase
MASDQLEIYRRYPKSMIDVARKNNCSLVLVEARMILAMEISFTLTGISSVYHISGPISLRPTKFFPSVMQPRGSVHPTIFIFPIKGSLKHIIENFTNLCIHTYQAKLTMAEQALTSLAVSGLPKIAEGKVRNLYEIDEKTLLFVASDRISAYDVIMQNVSLLLLCLYLFSSTSANFPLSMYSTSFSPYPSLITIIPMLYH